jgi:hypothetical protein
VFRSDEFSAIGVAGVAANGSDFGGHSFRPGATQVQLRILIQAAGESRRGRVRPFHGYPRPKTFPTRQAIRPSVGRGKGAIMNNSDHGSPAAANDPAGPVGPGRPDPGKTVLAVNSVVAAVGGTYAATHSIAATVVAGCAGVACAMVIVWKE